MAVLFRCLLCPPSSFSPSGARQSRVDLPRNGHDVTPHVKRAPIANTKPGMRFEATFDLAKIFSSCRSLTSAPEFFHLLNSKLVTDGLTEMSSCSTSIESSSPYHQILTKPATFLRFLVAVNVLTFTVPLESLAETCEPSNSLFSMPLLFAIAMIGATVGGLLARQRRGELARLNDQLRQINTALRRQAKIESYAPSLSYTPTTRLAEAEVVVDPRKEQLLTKLRAGKNFLRNQEPDKAFLEFKAAIDIAQTLEDHVEEKKAARGLGASLQRQGKYREAIKYHTRVLEVSKQTGEDSGSTEAYGAIADCYTELGDLERAGKFYDQYISRLESD